MLSTLGDIVSTPEAYNDEFGDIMSTLGFTMMSVEDIMSTLGVFSTPEDCHQYIGGYQHE